MKIRKVRKIDKLPIQALMEELNLYRKNIFNSENQKFHERATPYPPLEDNDLDDNLFFVAINNLGQIIGFIKGSVHVRESYSLSKLGCVDELYVQEKVHRQGVAKKLFVELEFEFKRHGCDCITTHTDFENELSQQFYVQSGMHKVTLEFWKKL